jgi:hypothetical protein
MKMELAAVGAATPAQSLLDAFKSAPTCVISDNLDRLAGCVGIKPFHRGGPDGRVGIYDPHQTRR